MEWMAIVILLWSASTTAPPPVIQVAVESERLCKDAVKLLARDLGKIAAGAAARGGTAGRLGEYNLVLTSCIRVAK